MEEGPWPLMGPRKPDDAFAIALSAGAGWVFLTIYSVTWGRGRKPRYLDDRCHPPESPADCKPSAKNGDVPRRIGRTKGGLNSKLHAVCDAQGRPIILCLSDHIAAKPLYPALPETASRLIGDKGHDGDAFRAALKARGITPCIPPRKGRNFPAGCSKTLYKQRHKVENMFGRLKDWRRTAMRFDRRAHTFFSAICIAAIVIWWI